MHINDFFMEAKPKEKKDSKGEEDGLSEIVNCRRKHLLVTEFTKTCFEGDLF